MKSQQKEKMFERKKKSTDKYSEKTFLLNEEKEKNFDEPKSKYWEKKSSKFENIKYKKLKEY